MKPLVRITKISAVENACHKTPSWREYDIGVANNGTSIPNDYCVEGYLIQAPEVGKPVVAQRIKRNGEKVFGFFQTSRVTSVEQGTFSTLNSCYKIDYIK
jgi:hypothetical protein